MKESISRRYIMPGPHAVKVTGRVSLEHPRDPEDPGEVPDLH